MTFLKRFARNRGAVIGLVILIAVVARLLAPSLYPQSPWRMVGRPFMAPFALERFPLGTDTPAATSPRAWSTARASR